jgi:hypothetical protein
MSSAESKTRRASGRAPRTEKPRASGGPDLSAETTLPRAASGPCPERREARSSRPRLAARDSSSLASTSCLRSMPPAGTPRSRRRPAGADHRPGDATFMAPSASRRGRRHRDPLSQLSLVGDLGQVTGRRADRQFVVPYRSQPWPPRVLNRQFRGRTELGIEPSEIGDPGASWAKPGLDSGAGGLREVQRIEPLRGQERRHAMSSCHGVAPDRGSNPSEIRARRRRAQRDLREAALRRPCSLSRRRLDDGGCRAALAA